MVTDLHAHYPMRVVSDVTPDTAVGLMRKAMRRPTLGDKLRALILGLASRFFSDTDPFSGYRITPQRLREGGVGVALSVLYRPSEELDPDERFASAPKPSYFSLLLGDLEAVEAEVGDPRPSLLRAVHDRAELDACVADGATGLVHCVEGGFHLGGDAAQIDANVAELARRGSPTSPSRTCSSAVWPRWRPRFRSSTTASMAACFRQREGEGLTDLGVAAVRAMARHRVLVDVSHMRADSIAETLQLLDEADPDRSLPVVSTHAGFRFGDQSYMHDEATVRRIAERDGVIGLITAEHQLLDGLDEKPEDFDGSFAVLRRHIDRIAEITGSHRNVALGTDFDGFVKPTLPGLQHMGDLARLEAALSDHYGAGSPSRSPRATPCGCCASSGPEPGKFGARVASPDRREECRRMRLSGGPRRRATRCAPVCRRCHSFTGAAGSLG